MDKKHKEIELYEKALNLFYEKKFEDAKKRFQELINDNNVPLTIKNRCEIFLKKCKSILNPQKNEPKTFEDYIDFAVYYLNLDELDNAKKYLKKAEKLNKDFHLIPYLYAVLNVKDGNFEKGVEFLKKAISINEKNRVFAKNDPDFEPLENYKPFQELIEIEEEE